MYMRELNTRLPYIGADNYYIGRLRPDTHKLCASAEIFIGLGVVLNCRFGDYRVDDNKSKAAKNFNVLILIYFQRSSMLVWKIEKMCQNHIHSLFKTKIESNCLIERRYAISGVINLEGQTYSSPWIV